MRKGRFSGLSEHSPHAAAHLSAADLLLFDFLAPDDSSDERVALDRAGPLALAPIFLIAAHLICGAALFLGLGKGAVALLPGLGAVLALDAGLWLASRRVASGKLRPHQLVRLAALHTIVAAAPWIWMLGVARGGDPVTVTAAIAAGAGAGVAAFFAVPGLLILSCIAGLGVAAFLLPPGALLGIFAAIAAALLTLSVLRAREAILSAYRRLFVEWQAEKARRFVADYEQSGRGWFWETNADGELSYVSEQLAAHLGTDASRLAGRPLGELLLLDEGAAGDTARHDLGFHLSTRFPFSDLTVRANSGEDIWWTLSGSPNFDHYGRFLGFRGVGSNLTAQRRSEAEISKLAKYDSLTGLPNRAMMRVTLDEALANAAGRKKGCSVFLIDLDRFKQVNDTLGHPVGDVLLRQVAERLREAIGDEGQIGRLGGDEFEAILPGLDQEASLASLAEKLIREVSKPYSIEGNRISIGASVGIAIAVPGRAYADALIKAADLALYAAKAASRGTFRFFAPEMHAESAERQILETDLAKALGQGQLRLVFQPIVDSVTEEAVAFEASLRWAHPTRGLLPPAAFMTIAEESGLIAGIGEWALRTACAEAAKWPGHVRVAVNLSPIQFGDPGLVGTLTHVLASSQIDPDRLELEITEGVFQSQSAGADEIFARLKATGVRLALDNFGTGQSSLGHLRKAPLDKIKIDRSFVRGAAEPGSRNAAIVRAIVTLAESLEMDTTAEGAESHEDVALIRQLGCSQVQGALFGEPLPPAEALARALESKGGRAESPDFSRPPRHRLIRTGLLKWDGRSLAVRLRNISEGGAMIECDAAMATDARVTLDLAEGGLLDADVRWAKDGQVGLRFAQPFDLGTLARSKGGKPAAKMLRPHYLDPAGAPRAAPAGVSPLKSKRARN